ncbi:hypothetical protein OG559_04130 [Micromonospora sp. NBC_01405]|uniref:hypothetical protein n=1 Tax=Micromonospora sp. NBC_01405 TaxID=2903589 RepID=UPI00324447F7
MAAPVLLWDLLLCAVLVVGWLLVVLLLALARGAPNASLVPGGLRPWHHLLAVLAVAVYLATTVWGADETPGHLLARATRGVGLAGDLARMVRLLMPTLVVTLAVAFVAGMTVPLPATVPWPEATSAPPRADDGVPVEASSTHGSSSTTGVETPMPSDDPGALRAQAEGVDALLAGSVTSRNDLAAALAAVGQCRDLNRSLTLLQSVARQRRAQRDRAEALTVDALADGPAMRGHLVSAFAHSGDADDAYAAWAQHSISSGCSLDANWRRGNRLSNQAQAAKTEFLRRWNPIARSCELPTRTVRDI